ncbi:uncharacterized protein LOC132202586 [Neocloeon triangulifer]|uniref:uncharacterized protein LOC132202586 n=1 Tax=Neocloeon triangulifer TaxID=2078957 RepID=UPI00286F282E|nr:uncharacterized protein LOC132202586 [Neocloeon triangulifer]
MKSSCVLFLALNFITYVHGKIQTCQQYCYCYSANGDYTMTPFGNKYLKQSSEPNVVTGAPTSAAIGIFPDRDLCGENQVLFNGRCRGVTQTGRMSESGTLVAPNRMRCGAGQFNFNGRCRNTIP